EPRRLLRLAERRARIAGDAAAAGGLRLGERAFLARLPARDEAAPADTGTVRRCHRGAARLSRGLELSLPADPRRRAVAQRDGAVRLARRPSLGRRAGPGRDRRRAV